MPKFRIMVRAQEDAVAEEAREVLSSIDIMGVTATDTHFENEFVRAVFDVPEEFDFDEFEEAAEIAVEDVFPGAIITKRAMVVRLMR